MNKRAGSQTRFLEITSARAAETRFWQWPTWAQISRHSLCRKLRFRPAGGHGLMYRHMPEPFQAPPFFINNIRLTCRTRIIAIIGPDFNRTL